MAQNFLTVTNILQQFIDQHKGLQGRGTVASLDQINNYSHEDTRFPLMYASIQDITLDQNADTYNFRVYCVDLLQKDRTNEGTVRNSTLMILRDFVNWITLDTFNNIRVISNTPIAIPVNNFLMDYTSGWYIDIAFETTTIISDCVIPFENQPYLSGVTCDIQYVSPFLTCETLQYCDSYININNNSVTTNSLSATSLSAGTIYSGGTNLYQIFGSASNVIFGTSNIVYLVGNSSDAAAMGGSANNVYTGFTEAYNRANILQTALGGNNQVLINVTSTTSGSTGDLILTADYNTNIRIEGFSFNTSQLGNIIATGTTGRGFHVGGSTAANGVYLSNIYLGGIYTQPASNNTAAGRVTLYLNSCILGDINTSVSGSTFSGNSGAVIIAAPNTTIGALNKITTSASTIAATAGSVTIDAKNFDFGNITTAINNKGGAISITNAGKLGALYTSSSSSIVQSINNNASAVNAQFGQTGGTITLNGFKCSGLVLTNLCATTISHILTNASIGGLTTLSGGTVLAKDSTFNGAVTVGGSASGTGFYNCFISSTLTAAAGTQQVILQSSMVQSSIVMNQTRLVSYNSSASAVIGAGTNTSIYNSNYYQSIGLSGTNNNLFSVATNSLSLGSGSTLTNLYGCGIMNLRIPAQATVYQSNTFIPASGLTITSGGRYIDLEYDISKNNITGQTFWSGSTPLETIISNLAGGGGTSTLVQPGSNIITGGTSSAPIVSVIASPSLNALILSGDGQFAAVTSTSLSATTLSGGTIFSGATNLYSIFARPEFVVNSVNAGSNITTGGTANSPTISVAASPSLNALTLSGAGQFASVTSTGLSANTLSGGTLYSGATNLSTTIINVASATGDFTRVQGSNFITTGGTANAPTINLAQNFSGATISGGTLYSGATNLSTTIISIANAAASAVDIAVQAGSNIATGGTAAAPTISVAASPSLNALTLSGAGQFAGVTATSLSANTLSGGTLYSGATNLSTTIINIANAAAASSGDITRVQPGSNITTGGTANAPTINVSASPSLNELTLSGAGKFAGVTSTGLSATTVSATTLFSGTTELGSIFNSYFPSIPPNQIAFGNSASAITSSPALIYSLSNSLLNINGGLFLGNITGSAYGIQGATLNTVIYNYNSTAKITLSNGLITHSVGESNFLGAIKSNSLTANTISGGTYFSGSTPLETIISNLAGGGTSTLVQPGSNIITGGTSSAPIVSVVSSPSLNGLILSGSAQLAGVTSTGMSATTISATTLFSGTTNLSTTIISVANAAATATGDFTRVQPGSNTTTGGTANAPIVNVSSTPTFASVSAFTISATTALLNGITANTLSATTTRIGSVVIENNSSANGGFTILGGFVTDDLSATNGTFNNGLTGKTFYFESEYSKVITTGSTYGVQSLDASIFGTSSPMTINLPSAGSNIGRKLVIKNTNSIGNIDVAPSGAEKIDNVNAIVNIPALNSITLQAVSSGNWYLI